MDLQKALEILEINSNEYSTLSESNLKKKYHKLALKNHPDKNGNTVLSKEKFQNIREAYECLKREISFLKNNEEDKTTTDFNNIVYLFINELLQGKNSYIFSDLVKDIIIGCKKISLKLFEKIEKDVCLDIYAFLSKYQNIFHISDEILDQVKEIIVEKYKEDQIYILNPSLSDLFDNNVYKLYLDEKLYIVPLWHSECYFDGINGEIIVKCIPTLPNNIELDEENNIIVNVQIPFSFSLFNKKTITVFLDEKICIDIPLNELYMSRFQTFVMKKKGISKISNDICEIENKSDIIIHLSFVDPS
jgi:hypothetical protein